MSPEYLNKLVTDVCATYADEQIINPLDGMNLPRQEEILKIIDLLQEVIFPGYDRILNYSMGALQFTIGSVLNSLYCELQDQISRSFRYGHKKKNCKNCDIAGDTERAVRSLMDSIADIREAVKLDVAAAYSGDPAAASFDEIVVSYPAIRAITIQRFAHILYRNGVPLIPRMMTEIAHSRTGIDINPGAQLGRGVFIDHGTGVVIGETAIIGNNVRIYQGVTLGALSFPKDACGALIKGAKRHPTIEDDVTIYAGATVLGDIVVGRGSVIGGNVWLTESLPPGTKITMAPPQHTVKFAKQ